MTLNHLKSKIQALAPLVEKLKKESLPQKKIEILNECPEVNSFLEEKPALQALLYHCTPEMELVVKSMLAIGEGKRIFKDPEHLYPGSELFRRLTDTLWEVESFYDMMGGVVGYHYTFLKLLLEKEQKTPESVNPCKYLKPGGVDISKKTPAILSYIRKGIENLPRMAEIYPVGGAGDRLNLLDEHTGEQLPAAQLLFLGKTILEGLIRDLQAREWLYYKLYGKQIQTPVVLMTSHEKHNHKRILDLCEHHRWFGRKSDHYFLIVQPLVPIITEDGNWVVNNSLHISVKPGGHGVLWKLAHDWGAFEWLFNHKREKALLRQINNPIAGIDNGLLAFYGLGCSEEKDFGFAACPRLVNASEGMIVLVEKEEQGKFEYKISNIEYTDFSKKGMEDLPESPNSSFSQFPANTNILFADLHAIEKFAEKSPLPGMLINMKNSISVPDDTGALQEVKGGRVESTMQNISDFIKEYHSHTLQEEEMLRLKTFVTYNDRKKTISVTKHSYNPGQSIAETPEGAFFDLLQNNRELLTKDCSIQVPEMASVEDYLRNGPSFIFHYHPALGPLYSIIGQKLRGGRLAKNAELQLEIADADIQDLDLDGSMLIQADSPLGRADGSGFIQYGSGIGKCLLKNVRVKNKGINREENNVYWKNQIARHEWLRIVIQGSGEFIAEDVAFQGNYLIEVPDNTRVRAYQTDEGVSFEKTEIRTPSWSWNYSFDENNNIELKKKQQTP